MRLTNLGMDNPLQVAPSVLLDVPGTKHQLAQRLAVDLAVGVKHLISKPCPKGIADGGEGQHLVTGLVSVDQTARLRRTPPPNGQQSFFPNRSLRQFQQRE